MNRVSKTIISSLFVCVLVSISNISFANNLAISNISLESRNPSSSSVVIQFDVAWDNSWKTKINHDAVWLTVRLHNTASSLTDKKLCQIAASGLNPAGTSPGSASNLELYVPSDQSGAFLRPATFGTNGTMATEDVELTIDYSSCGFATTDDVKVSVLGIEMVLVPEGAFYAGDYATSTAALVQGSADNDPWYISSESALSVSNAASDGYYYASAGLAGEAASGSSFVLPVDFPNGYSAFYMMKYEITEEQWTEFVNALPSVAARANRDLTNSAHKNSDAVIKRNTLSCSGSPLMCTSARPARAASYLNWADLAAFLDWAALRPMTELEYEKAARGPLVPVEGEFAWGTRVIVAATGISGSEEDGTETVTTTSANAHYDNTGLTGGDTNEGSEYTRGPLRAGIFATSTTTRETAGAGYYGGMELSGNLREHVVSIGREEGREFTGIHGDGVLSTESGYEGNADVEGWPGMDVVSTRGVTGAAGTGFRGGAWDDDASALRISDRSRAAEASMNAASNAGGRGVRTYEE